MSERDDMGGRSGRQPAEGVRIIRAEEAQAALDAGEAAGRRPDDQLRFGDVPPVPSGPRPAHRFPLPDSVDPAEAVSLPPLASPRRSSDPGGWGAAEQNLPEPEEASFPAPREPGAPGDQYDPYESSSEYRSPGPSAWSAMESPASAAESPAWTNPASTSPPAPPPAAPSLSVPPQPLHPAGTAGPASGSTWDPGPGGGWDPGDRTTEMDAPVAHFPDVRIAEEGITVSSGAPEMPHWADPPTGEVPILRMDGESEPGDDDLEAWKALGSRGVRWRDGDDWDDAEEISDLVGDVERVGALDSSRSAHSDIYSFDEDFERVTSRTVAQPVMDFSDDLADGDAPAVETELAAPTGTRPSARQSRPTHSGRASGSQAERGARRTAPPRTPPHPPAGGDAGGRVAIGLGLIVLLIICYAIGAKALVVLAGVVIVAAAAEAYSMLRGAGFRPATLLGLIATAGVVGGAYWKGIGAIPIVTVLLFAGAMMWYVLGIVEARPLANVAVTVMVFVWVGVLGAFAPVMLAQRHGQGEFLGAVVVAVAADICAFAVGRVLGSRPIAEHISPNKTVEGFIGGLVGAVIAGLIIGKELAPWGGMKHGLLLGVVIGLIAPAGDLFESMMKRDLGIKDSGRLLGGHGGLLDRFDSILLALPAAYFVVTWFKL
ncbi:MAG: phosphatidate cytidylyltransferase [Acidimicrobiales bacterium]|nr:phosphatidate cytidylyltransferase [Acidimicrobiales bacterium]